MGTRLETAMPNHGLRRGRLTPPVKATPVVRQKGEIMKRIITALAFCFSLFLVEVASASEKATSLSPDQLIALGTVVLAFFTGISVYVAFRTEKVFKLIVKNLIQTAEILNHTQAEAHKAKVVQTMATCIEQYQSLENQLNARPRTITADRYVEQLWNIHFAQFHYFKLGFLPPEIYGLWVWIRYQNYHTDHLKELIGKSEADGWSHAKKYLRDEAFGNFVENWIRKPDIKQPYIMEIIKTLLPSKGELERKE
jgi:hypothetical protein